MHFGLFTDGLKVVETHEEVDKSNHFEPWKCKKKIFWLLWKCQMFCAPVSLV